MGLDGAQALRHREGMRRGESLRGRRQRAEPRPSRGTAEEDERGMQVEGALEKIREICLSLPETTEGTHGGKACSPCAEKLFLTFGGKRAELGVGLEPAHAAALVSADPRFRPCPRDKRR